MLKVCANCARIKDGDVWTDLHLEHGYLTKKYRVKLDVCPRCKRYDWRDEKK